MYSLNCYFFLSWISVMFILVHAELDDNECKLDSTVRGQTKNIAVDVLEKLEPYFGTK